MKKHLSVISIFPGMILLLTLSACSLKTQPNGTATPIIYPVQQLEIPPVPAYTPTRVSIVAYPTGRRDFTPIPNLTPGAWLEFSSEITYTSPPDGIAAGPLHFRVQYPPDWYLYPGYTVIYPGGIGTHIQNYKGDTNQENLRLETGRVHLTLTAKPCNSTEQGCLAGLPLLSPGLPGTKEVRYQDESNLTYWNTYLYIKDMQFAMYGIMSGIPEENTSLINILDEILATVVIEY
jgi:hypothetical protein